MPEAIHVECYSGSRYGERPISFTLRGDRYVVRTVDNSWRTPSALHFQVRTEDNQLYELVYHEEADAWSVKSPRGQTSLSR